jgi:hypothetical protein
VFFPRREAETGADRPARLEFTAASKSPRADQFLAVRVASVPSLLLVGWAGGFAVLNAIRAFRRGAL